MLVSLCCEPTSGSIVRVSRRGGGVPETINQGNRMDGESQFVRSDTSGVVEIRRSATDASGQYLDAAGSAVDVAMDPTGRRVAALADAARIAACSFRLETVRRRLELPYMNRRGTASIGASTRLTVGTAASCT